MTAETQSGSCFCGAFQFTVSGRPMIVHACHCIRCQKRTGTPLAINFWIEASRVQTVAGTLEKHAENIDEQGNKSDSWRCTECGYGIWTRYHAAGSGSLFVKAGLLDNPSAFPPDVHIFTRSKQPWMVIPDDVPAFEAYYNFRDVWSEDSQRRFRELKARSDNAS